MKKSRLTASVIINFLIFAITTGVIISYFLGNLTPEVKTPQQKFIFFTTDSNILAAAASLATGISNILIMRNKLKEIPKLIMIFKFMGTVSLLVTFATVMVLLIPIYGPEMLLGKTAFHMHLGAPVMCFVSFAFLDGFKRIKLSYIPIGVLPMAVYAVIYLTMVVFIGEANGGWYDFYAFNRGGRWYISLVVMFAATFLLSTITLLIHNKFCKKTELTLEK